MRTNTKAKSVEVFTHEGAKAYPHLTPIQQLRRSVLSCLLWEDEFYEDGQSIADWILETAYKCKVDDVAALAIEARSKLNLRHVPLLLLCALTKMAQGKMVGDTICQTIQRADELSELIAVYMKVNGQKKAKLSAQMKRGIGLAFRKFNAYSLAKYSRDSVIKLRDALFMSHAQPKDAEQADVFKKLAENTLESPDTWEVALSAGADKKETFERLIREGQLGYFALIRNLRNMEQAGCDRKLVSEAILARKNGAERVLPFRFIAAAQEVPTFEAALDAAMCETFSQVPKLAGKTVLIVDISGSMGLLLSTRSKMSRMDAACALAAVARECCEQAEIYATAGNDFTRVHATAKVPARRGMAMIDAVRQQNAKLGGGGIFLTPVMRFVEEKEKTADRIIVFTDEQDCAVSDKDKPGLATPFGRHNYLINVSSNKNGIGYGKWVHIDGFSEQVLRFIHEIEL